MKIYYRISNNSYNKIKLQHATKEYCLINFLDEFGNFNNEIEIIADNVTDGILIKLLNKLTTRKNINIEFTSLGNAQSFKYVYNKSLCLNDDELVYFVEDDYLHLPNSNNILIEGLNVSHYVTLYDHADKYVDYNKGGDNPFIDGGGEITRVILTPSKHWKLTNSTTMTFAACVKTLKEDKDIWMKHLQTNHPNDFIAFLDLREKQRTLISPIPGVSTHCEIKYLSPLINWEKI